MTSYLYPEKAPGKTDTAPNKHSADLSIKWASLYSTYWASPIIWEVQWRGTSFSSNQGTNASISPQTPPILSFNSRVHMSSEMENGAGIVPASKRNTYFGFVKLQSP